MSVADSATTTSQLLALGRTHSCGDLRREHVGARVVLFGWVHRRRDLGGRIFVQLRDRDGITQISFVEDIDAAAYAAAEGLRGEFCVGVAGTVVDRGDNENPDMPTGAIEVEADRLEIFSESAVPPFNVADDDRLEAQEALRLRYRYLDLRRPSLQRNFILRSRIGYVTRRTLSDLGFFELETPYMVKYTPGGARNFLVPSRLHPGMFYALAESPQIYKQLFMVAGFDKYFQITRCFRDEDLRLDRQPEFTQIDVELSFATPAQVFAPMESLMVGLWSEVLGIEIERPFARMTWDEAMARFGTDKPDLRFGLELLEATEATRESGFRVFEEAACVKGLCVPPQHAKSLRRAQIDKLTAFVKQREHGGAKGLAWTRVGDSGQWEGGIAKLVAPEARESITSAWDAAPGSLLLFVADDWSTVHTALDALRLELRDRLDLLAGASDAWSFLWVTDFPLMERNEHGKWVSSHHPFTAPRPEHVQLLESDPGKVRAQAYDLVLNGNEIGGGSIRIHRPDVQAKVFTALGLSNEDAQRKFGFLLEAFKYGPPPHGGIALGLDRIAMLMCGAESLRDVIAFPKTQRGQDLMTQCPTPVEDDQLGELYVTHRPLPKPLEPEPKSEPDSET
jgi:aspartyl-tRNA synthetase